MAEWLKAHAWKVCIRESVSRVRIPLCPPAIHFKHPELLLASLINPTRALPNLFAESALDILWMNGPAVHKPVAVFRGLARTPLDMGLL